MEQGCIGMGENTQKSQADIEWENRVLCSDGNCIGILGADGRCKECGSLYEGDLPAAQSENAPEAVPPEPSEHPEAESESIQAEENPASISDDDWENRRLCADGNCIGVIGPDGKCKECGRPYEP